MCWVQVEVRLSYSNSAMKEVEYFPSLQTEAAEVEFSQLVKFLSQNLSLALKGTEGEAEQEVRDRSQGWERMFLEDLICAGAFAYYSCSFSPLGPDPGLAGIQLWTPSLNNLVKMHPPWGEGICGWGRGNRKLFLGWGEECKAQGSRSCARIPEMLCPRGWS